MRNVAMDDAVASVDGGTGPHRLLTAVVAALFVLAAGAALAVPTAVEAQDPMDQPEPQVEVDDEELRDFAEAHLEIEEIRADLERQLQAAEDAAEAQEIQQQGDALMVEAIEGEGLTVDRYTEIVNAINVDPELQERFFAMVEEIRDDEGGGTPY